MSTDYKTERFSAPCEGVTSASIKLGLSAGEMIVHAAPDTTSLIDAQVNHLGEVDFRVSGEAEKIVTLTQKLDWVWDWFNPANWASIPDLRWDVAMAPGVPLHLEILGGAGRCHFDLSGLELTALTINIGAGEVDVTLPASATAYHAVVNGGAGKLTVTVAAGAALDLRVTAGAGAIEVETPADAAVRFDARFGLGDVKAAPKFTRVSGGSSELPFGAGGVWETAGFAGAARPISIRFEGGVGNLVIR